MDASGRRFRSCLVGDAPLTIQCGEKLLGEGFSLAAVVSTDAQVTAWAAKEKLATFETCEQAMTSLGEGAVDYLFSVICFTLLKREVLAWPLQWAINYHDAPLPRYAGVHATSWAILGDETRHGVTWHIMTEKPDAGDVLVQADVPVFPADTALDLNLRCHAAAMQSFDKLLAAIRNGSVRARPQELSVRTYFAASRKEPFASVVRWTEAASDIDRMIRAHALGSFAINRFGLSKIMLTGGVIFPLSAIPLNDAADANLANGPGVVATDSSGALLVSTGRGRLRITELLDENGTIHRAPGLLEKLGIVVGQCLPMPSPDALRHVARQFEESSRGEAFCAEALKAAIPMAAPRFAAARTSVPARLSLTVPAEVLRSARGFDARCTAVDVLRAAVVIWINRNAVEVGSISYSADVLLSRIAGCEPLIHAGLPMSVELNYDQTARQIAADLREQSAQIERHGVYAADSPIRYRFAPPPPLPISLHIGAVAADLMPAQLAIVISPDASSITLTSTPTVSWTAFTENELYELSQLIMAAVRVTTSSPDVAVGELDLLPIAMRGTIDRFNRSEPCGSDATVTQLFSAQADRSPEALAIVCGDRQLTYEQVDAFSDVLAGRLRRAGVTPGQFVGLSAQRSAETIVALLAILKAGAAYVPIASDLPLARQTLIVRDAGIAIAVKASDDACDLRRLGCQVVTVGLAQLLQAEAVDVLPHVAASHPAYINYTSGSTGTPKAVVVPHRGIVRLAAGELRLSTSARVLNASTLSFDAATYEIWAPLLSGAAVVVLRVSPPTPSAIADAICRQGVDTAFLTTALFNQAVEQTLPELAGLRLLITGGEVMSPAHAKRFLSAHPLSRLFNAYGPTENTAFSTLHPVTIEHCTARLPIGRPIAGTRCYVLDRAQRQVAIGIVGELYVAGAGLAIGYLNHPELTDRQFVPDGFYVGTSEANSFASSKLAVPERMYRTGDLARWDEAGNLHFCGRVDRQVKIRGFRIELGEIEAAINAQPGVAGCAVIARDVGGDQRLVAYVVPIGTFDLEALKAALSAQLPAYLEPAAWVVLSSLPLTAHGKLDVNALPAPSHTADGRPPRTELEKVVCGLFAETLGVDAVDLDDHFFELGGHSLLATRLLSRLRETLGVDLSLRAVFTHPTVHQLLPHLTGRAAARPPLVKHESREPVPQSPAQRRLWFFEQLQSGTANYHIPLAYSVRGPLDVAALQDALVDLMDRHESLRTIFPVTAGVATQRVLPAASVGRLLAVERCPPGEVMRRIAALTSIPFDLAAHPPLRVHLLNSGDEQFVLLLVLHHIAADGGSLRPLWLDLAQAYAARRTGAAPRFERLSVQYADYTLWQQSLLGDVNDPSSLAGKQRAFWLSALAGAPPLSTLTPDFDRPAISRHRGGSVTFSVSPETHARLLLLANECGASLFIVLQAVLAVTLREHAVGGTGREVVLGAPVAGRDDPLLTEQIGLFVNTIALRVDLRGRPTVGELVGRVKAFTLDAFANADLPFDEVVKASGQQRSLATHPIFQVMLVLQNNDRAEARLHGVQVEKIDLLVTTSKFDLLLDFEQRPVDNVRGSNTATLAAPVVAGGPTGELIGKIDYDSDLYSPATISGYAERFAQTLQRFVKGSGGSPWRSPDESAEEMAPMTLPSLIAATSSRFPNEPAILSIDEPALTYTALTARLESLAGQLREIGIRRGDRVAIVLPNGPEMAIAFLAVAAVGAAAPLNPAYRKAEFEFFLSDLSAKAVIVLDRSDQAVTAVARSLGMAVIRITGGNAGPRFACDDHFLQTPRADDHPPKPDDVAMLLHTSGTTAKPKLVPLSHANLCASATNIAKWLALKPGDTCLNVMPLFHIHGIAAALLASLSAGAAVACATGFEATRFLEWLASYRPTWFTAVPTMHAAILARAELESAVRSLAPLRMIRSSSAALPPTVAEGLERVFGVPVIEAYGMTEAAHQMCCNPLPPAARKPGSVGIPAGPEVAVLDAAGRVLPPGGNGEVAIRGANVTAGYADNLKANAEAFIGDWFRTGDLGHFDEDGYLFLSGRSKEIINRGGEKISPREIDETLLRHPAVAAAVAFAVPDAKLGEEIGVAIVLRDGMTLSERDVRAFASANLADFKVPRRVVFLSDLPKGATGKVQRVGLAKTLGIESAPLQAHSVTTSPAAAPHTPFEQRLFAIWSEVLRRVDFGVNDSFIDLGGDSILAAQVISRTQAAGLGELPVYAFFEKPTIAATAAVLASAGVAAGESGGGNAPASDNGELDQLLASLESMSDEEAQAALAREAMRERIEPS